MGLTTGKGLCIPYGSKSLFQLRSKMDETMMAFVYHIGIADGNTPMTRIVTLGIAQPMKKNFKY
jgi:hypothetical protein